MPGQTFRGVGRHRTAEDGQGDMGSGNMFHASAGYTESNDHHRRALDLGVGILDSEHMDMVTASGQLGAWETENGGTQLGAKGSAEVIGMEGSLGDLAGIFTGNESESDEGGWQNFLGFHGNLLSGWGEAQAGTEGARVGAQASAISGGATIGGAEYDWFGGTEIGLTAAGAGAGASAGLHWSDDDGDGIRELGGQIGGSWGIGGNISVKTELLGHAMNAAADGWDWLTN